MSRKKTVTMQDIADKLNISKVSVSKAINGKDGVGQELREEILRCAQELKYKLPNTKTILPTRITVIVREIYVDTTEYVTFYLNLYQKLVSTLNPIHYICTLFTLNESKITPQEMKNIHQHYDSAMIVVMGNVKYPYIEALEQLYTPIIYLDTYYPEKHRSCIVTENFYSSYEITKYLIECGHKTLGFVGNYTATASIQDRYLGYRRALMECGLDIQEKYDISDRDDDGEGIDIVVPKDIPSAYVCNCDDTAYKVIKTLKKQGISVPNDVSVVGFDNEIYAELSTPKITTIAVDIELMIQKTVGLIEYKLKNNDFCNKLFVPAFIIERDSVKK